MKINYLNSVLVLFALLFFISGCSQPTADIEISSDGYGKTTLANGITVLVNHDEATSLTAGRILLSGGVLTESADNNGITNLMTRMLLKGNQKMNADEISERLEFLGVSYSVNCNRDYSTISFQCLSEYFDEVFEIIAASLVNPIFPDEELTRLKTEMEGAIKAEDDYQPQASSKLFWKTIYGNEGYGLPTNGTLESIQSIDIQDIKDHYHNYVGGNNLIVSVVSDLEPNRIVLKIENELKGLMQQANRIPKPSLALQTEKTGFISYDRNQSFIYMGIVLDRLNPDEVPYTILLNEIMGGSVSARLWYLRQKEKLAYAVYTQFAFDKYDAVFQAAIGTDTAKVEQALNSLDREWNKMVSDGITDTELMDAKINMKNNLFYWIDRKRNRANNIAYLEYLGYGYHFVQDLINAADKVELAEINRFISEKFSDDRRYVSIVGKK